VGRCALNEFRREFPKSSQQISAELQRKLDGCPQQQGSNWVEIVRDCLRIQPDSLEWNTATTRSGVKNARALPIRWRQELECPRVAVWIRTKIFTGDLGPSNPLLRLHRIAMDS